MTPQEVKLWARLRAMRTEGHHFRRQSPLGPYVVDFECRKAKLVIEVDGSQHGSDFGLARDAERDRLLTAGVLEAIIDRLNTRTR